MPAPPDPHLPYAPSQPPDNLDYTQVLVARSHALIAKSHAAIARAQEATSRAQEANTVARDQYARFLLARTAYNKG